MDNQCLYRLEQVTGGCGCLVDSGQVPSDSPCQKSLAEAEACVVFDQVVSGCWYMGIQLSCVPAKNP